MRSPLRNGSAVCVLILLRSSYFAQNFLPGFLLVVCFNLFIVKSQFWYC